jgi:hypothetical protein
MLTNSPPPHTHSGAIADYSNYRKGCLVLCSSVGCLATISFIAVTVCVCVPVTVSVSVCLCLCVCIACVCVNMHTHTHRMGNGTFLPPS